MSASAFSIDFSRYAGSATRLWPFVSSTWEPARPLNVGPVPFEPSSEWQPMQPSDV